MNTTLTSQCELVTQSVGTTMSMATTLILYPSERMLLVSNHFIYDIIIITLSIVPLIMDKTPYYTRYHGNFFQTVKQSNIPIRLVSTYPGLNFLGRVEVFHNNQWGTICDDLFGYNEANVVCQMLNFTRGSLCYSSYTFGRGTGTYQLHHIA